MGASPGPFHRADRVELPNIGPSEYLLKTDPKIAMRTGHGLASVSSHCSDALPTADVNIEPIAFSVE
jgi:hypothetical protein